MNDKRKGSASREKPCSHLVSFIYFLMLILCKILFSVTLTVKSCNQCYQQLAMARQQLCQKRQHLGLELEVKL